MRHRRAGYKLGRTSSHRTATLRNLAAGLFEHGQITTTLQRAKAVQPMVEKIVTLAKRGDMHARRLVAAKLGRDRQGFAWLTYGRFDDEETAKHFDGLSQKQADAASKFFNVPGREMVKRDADNNLIRSPRLVKHIFENVAPRFKDRAGGYTRVVKLGKFRIGDAGELVVLQFVGAEDGPEIGGNLSRRRRIADKRTAFAKKVREGMAAKKAE
jgi:large subunit ribosomal protein L17